MATEYRVLGGPRIRGDTTCFGSLVGGTGKYVAVHVTEGQLLVFIQEGSAAIRIMHEQERRDHE